MAAILTAEDVVRRIAAECAYVDAAIWGAIPAVAATASASAGEVPLGLSAALSFFGHKLCNT